MKTGDDISLCNVNAEYAIYGNEEKNSASSSSLQLQPKHYQSKLIPQSRLSWLYTGFSGFPCYQGQICRKFFSASLSPWLSYRSSP